MENYRDFLWKVGYAQGIFVVTPPESSPSYKAYIGGGNNSLMVRGILRRRTWWALVEKESEANFVWTQLKVNKYF